MILSAKTLCIKDIVPIKKTMQNPQKYIKLVL